MDSAIILAGGLGTRLRSVVSDVPKPMAPVGGRPFLEWQMDRWRHQGIEKFILSVGYLRSAIIDYFGDEYRGASIEYAIEDVPLGTGGALLHAIRHVKQGKPFLLLNGDTYFDVEASALLSRHCELKAGVTFSLFRAGEADRYGGVEMDPSGYISSFAAGKAALGQLANGGVYVIEPSVVTSYFSDDNTFRSFESDMLPFLAESGVRMAGFECSGSFIDIGVPSDYVAASKVISTSKGRV